MTLPTLTPDPDPIDRQRACDLGRAGLPGYCAAVVVNSQGEEILMLAQYNQGEGDYITDWAAIAPHEVPGLPVYRKG